jgi:hypothetical protein
MTRKSGVRIWPSGNVVKGFCAHSLWEWFKPSFPHPESFSFVTAFAVVRVCVTKGALTVVAGFAVCCAYADQVGNGRDGRHLSSLRESAALQQVAILATDARVISVAEAQPKCARVRGSRHIASRLITVMTGAA